jgi:hypothetical protein
LELDEPGAVEPEFVGLVDTVGAVLEIEPVLAVLVIELLSIEATELPFSTKGM